MAACPLDTGAQSGRAAGKFTRNTLKEWGLVTLADDAEAIVGEFVANAVSHAARSAEEPGQPLGLRLLRRTGEVMCAVLDPSDRAPVLRTPDRNEEAGRGLQMVDALSDVLGLESGSPAAERPSGPSCSARYLCFVNAHYAPGSGLLRAELSNCPPGDRSSVGQPGVSSETMRREEVRHNNCRRGYRCTRTLNRV